MIDEVDIDGDGRIDYDGILIKTYKNFFFLIPFCFLIEFVASLKAERKEKNN